MNQKWDFSSLCFKNYELDKSCVLVVPSWTPFLAFSAQWPRWEVLHLSSVILYSHCNPCCSFLQLKEQCTGKPCSEHLTSVQKEWSVAVSPAEQPYHFFLCLPSSFPRWLDNLVGTCGGLPSWSSFTSSLEFWLGGYIPLLQRGKFKVLELLGVAVFTDHSADPGGCRVGACAALCPPSPVQCTMVRHEAGSCPIAG